MTARDDLSEYLNISNSYYAVKYARARGVGPDVYVGYRPGDWGRVAINPAWQVHRPGYKTDPSEHWRNHGDKTFNVNGRDEKAEMGEAAKAWAADRYGVTGWAKIPGLPGDWFPKPVADLVNTDLRAARRANPRQRTLKVFSAHQATLPGEWREACGMPHASNWQGGLVVVAANKSAGAELLAACGASARSAAYLMDEARVDSHSNSVRMMLAAGILDVSTPGAVTFHRPTKDQPIVRVDDPALPVVAHFRYRSNTTGKPAGLWIEVTR